MARCLRLTICTLAVALSLHAADPSSNASGTLKVNGVTTNLRYAYAFKDSDNATRVLLTSKPMTAPMLAAEAALGTSGEGSPFRALVQKGEAGAIELFVTPDGMMQTVMVFDKRFEMPTPSTSDSAYWFEPYRMTEGWTGARSRTKQQQEFFDTKWEYDVAYFAPVGQKSFEVPSASAIAAQQKEIDAREKARIVAKGGGEEGAMFLSFYKNLEATSAKAILEQMTPAMKNAIAADMQTKTLTDSHVAAWAMSRSMPPGNVEIIGGVRDPQQTILELRKTSGGSQKFGTATMVKEGGVWKVAELTW